MDTPSKKQHGARRKVDALSLFLGASMLLLGTMYVIDSQQSARIHESASIAASLQPTLKLPSDCTISTAGQDNDILTIACKAHSTAELQDTLRPLSNTLPPWINAIALRDSSMTTTCTTHLDQCEHHTLPTRTELKLTRQRSRRTEQTNP